MRLVGEGPGVRGGDLGGLRREAAGAVRGDPREEGAGMTLDIAQARLRADQVHDTANRITQHADEAKLAEAVVAALLALRFELRALALLVEQVTRETRLG